MHPAGSVPILAVAVAVPAEAEAALPILPTDLFRLAATARTVLISPIEEMMTNAP